MHRLTAKTTEENYDIILEPGGLDEAWSYLSEEVSSDRLAIITDETVDNLYSEVLTRQLNGTDNYWDKCVIPEGEGSKTLETAEDVYRFLTDRNYLRDSTLISLGGGVVGDLTGFVASTYTRGINLIQVPTTWTAV